MKDRGGDRQDSEARRLVDRVVSRLWVSSVGEAWLLALLWLGSACFVALLIRRLSGFGVDWLTAEAAVGVPVFAVLIAVLSASKPTVFAAARKIDECCELSELFLTLAQLESSAGAYQSAIAEQAEVLAGGLQPSVIVSWSWQRPVARLTFGLAVLVSSFVFLPQLDPFGNVDSTAAAVAVRRDLQDSRRETANRTAELLTRQDSAGFSNETSLVESAAKLKQLTVDRSKSDLKNLEDRQREIEARWREARSDEGVSRLLEQAESQQFFGASENRSKQWATELAGGQTESLDQAFGSLQESLEQLASAADGGDRQALDKQVRQQIAELQRFAGNQLQSQSAEAAMKRATSQLNSARLNSDLQSEAIEAARESIELGREELHELAENAEQLASLEQALNAIQSAKQLAQEGTQEAFEQNQAAIQEFVEQYAKMEGDGAKQQSDPAGDDEGKLESQGQQIASADGQSESKGPRKAGAKTQGKSESGTSKDSAERGPGRSASRENNLAKSDFRNARERAGLDTTRRLLVIRRQGMSDAGETSQEYRQLVRNLQKRVSTAIEVEEIPPGYVSGIRSYFDSLDPQSEQSSGNADAFDKSSDVKGTNDDSSEAADEVP